MTDPAMLAIATAAAAAMAGKSTEALGEAAKRAMGALTTRIRQRFHGRPEDEAVLDAIVADPDSITHRQALAEMLDRASTEDPDFKNETLDLARRAGIHIADQTHTTNVINAGSVGKVVSAGRDINVGGDLSL
jgi:hypothetical protein